MKSSNYLLAAALAGALMLSGCNQVTDGGFTGNNLPGGPPGGGGGGGGGTGGGGGGGGGGSGGGGSGGSFTEPRLAHRPDTGGGVFNVNFSGNGEIVVFVGTENTLGSNPDNGEQIFATSIATGGLVQITAVPATPSIPFTDIDITGSGTEVVFTSNEDLTGDNPTGRSNLFIASTGGSGITQVTRNMEVLGIRDPEVSGDGSRLAFASEADLLGTNATNDNQIYIINRDGTGLTQLTFDSSFPQALAMSHNGLKIAFITGGDPLGTNGDFNRELFVIDTDGTNLTQLTDSVGPLNTLEPQISDDGSRIVFRSDADPFGTNADGNIEAFTVNADGSALTQITESTSDAEQVDISGNGQYIVFTSASDLTGDNPNGDRTVFWADSSGTTIGQAIREGLVSPSILSRSASGPRLNDSGDVILFESPVNYSFDASGNDEKIFTTRRE